MKTVYKYPLQVSDEQVLRLPAGAELLGIQTQRNVPCLWALVDTEKALEEVRLRTVGTGHPFADAAQWGHLASYQLDGGLVVFHVFRAVR